MILMSYLNIATVFYNNNNNHKSNNNLIITTNLFFKIVNIFKDFLIPLSKENNLIYLRISEWEKTR